MSEVEQLTESQKFWANVERAVSGGCWLWRGSATSEGYGYWRRTFAHRWSYTAAKGEIPKGLEIDHLCKQPSCVNPAPPTLRRSPIA